MRSSWMLLMYNWWGCEDVRMYNTFSLAETNDQTVRKYSTFSLAVTNDQTVRKYSTFSLAVTIDQLVKTYSIIVTVYMCILAS